MPDPAAEFVVELPFARYVGLEAAEEGALALTSSALLENHVGTLHAGALFTLGESASGVALARVMASGLGNVMPVAKSATIEFKRPARGRVRAQGAVAETCEAIAARVRDTGKTTVDVTVTMKDEAETEVAAMVVTWHVRTIA